MTRKIVVKLESKELPKLKSILALREGELADLNVTGLRYGKLGDEALISFNIDEKHLRPIVEKILLNDLKILHPDEHTLKIIEQFQVPAVLGAKAVKNASWDELKEKASSAAGAGASGLDEYIRTGNYEKVIQVLKDIKNDSATIERAKSGLPTAVINAIEKNFNTGIQNKYEADKYITALVKIAGDDKLKTLRMFDSLKAAGHKAIELCQMFPEQTDNLIRICNNSALINSVNVMSAIVFSKIAFANENSNPENLDYAVKNLNIRWLQIAWDIVEFEFDSSGAEYFNKLIDYVKSKR